MAAAVMTAMLALPVRVRVYERCRDIVGTRTSSEFRLYSASIANFLSAPQMNRLYGGTRDHRPDVG